MKTEKLDRRIRYTRMVLRQSLLELLTEKPIGKITVTDICTRADVNRNTFYAHYSCPSELLLRIEDELFDEVSDVIEAAASDGNISVMLENVCAMISENADLCLTLFSENGDKEFLNRIIGVGQAAIIACWKRRNPKISDTRLEKLYVFLKFGSIALIRDWVTGGYSEAPDRIAALISNINDGVLLSVLSAKE